MANTNNNPPKQAPVPPVLPPRRQGETTADYKKRVKEELRKAGYFQ